MPTIGTTIGRYELLKSLAAGGMGEVFLARHQASESGFESLVAIKVLLQNLTSNRAFVEMFLDEARTVAKLRHEHIVQIRDIAKHAGQYYMVMEYIPGLNLRELLADATIEDRPLFSARLGAQLFADLASALSVVHRHGLVHRDLSPNNIMISDAGVPKLIDFGVARALGNASLTTPGTLKGKFGYMAPEYIRSQAYDHRVDLFSLGVVMWETFARRRLFQGTNAAEQLHKVLDGEIPRLDELLTGFPMSLADLVACALQRDPERRIPTAGALADALGEVARAQPVDPSERTLGRWLERRLATQIEDRRRGDQELMALPPGAMIAPPPSTAGAEVSELYEVEVSSRFRAATPVPSNLNSGVSSGVSLRLANGELGPATAREVPARSRWNLGLSIGAGLVLAAVALVALTRGSGDERTTGSAAMTSPPSPPPAPAPPTTGSAAAARREAGLAAMAEQDYARAISEFAEAMRGGADPELVQLLELARRLQRDSADKRVKPAPAPMATALPPTAPTTIVPGASDRTVPRARLRSALSPERRLEAETPPPGAQVEPASPVLASPLEVTPTALIAPSPSPPPPAPVIRAAMSAPIDVKPAVTPTPRVIRDGDLDAGRHVVARCNGCHATSGAASFSSRQLARAQWERFFATGKHDRYVAIGDRFSGTQLEAARAFLRAYAYDAAEHQGAGIREP